MRVGGYTLGGELGRGGMGAVFRAVAPDGREVAVKVLHRGARSSGRDRFERERRLLAELSESDGFVPLLDSGEDKGQPFIVMPLVGGGTLRDRLKQGPLAIEATIELAEALALAIGRAHELGIVHRDLKPENVLFRADGKPLVGDLGLAKHFETDAPATSQAGAALSRTGVMAGTAGYMAPEQARDAKFPSPSRPLPRWTCSRSARSCTSASRAGPRSRAPRSSRC